MPASESIAGKVSIILTTFNGEDYIRDTINSVQQQTWDQWELIIVDDGSTDATTDIVRSIADDRVKLISAGRIARNGILKNRALSCSTGEFIAFIDHDDLWAAEKLHRQIEALGAHPSVEYCLCNGYNFTTVGQPAGYFFKQNSCTKSGDLFLSFFNGELSAFTQSLLARKSCLEKANWFDEDKQFADAEFVLNLAAKFHGVILFEPMVFHRKHEKGFSLTNWVQGHEQGVTIIRQYIQNGRLPKKIGRESLFRCHISFGEKYLVNHERRKAILQFAKAWKTKLLSRVPPKKMVKTIFRLVH